MAPHTTWPIQKRPAILILDATGRIRYENLSPENVDAAIDELLAASPKRQPIKKSESPIRVCTPIR